MLTQVKQRACSTFLSVYEMTEKGTKGFKAFLITGMWFGCVSKLKTVSVLFLLLFQEV